MRCLGVGAQALRRTWNGPHGALRRSDTVECPVCGKYLAPRKDGRARAHRAPDRPPRPSLVGQLDEHLQREPRPRKVTQK